ncbi:MAG: hypothetical protein AAGI49_09930 [Bacteroidota bacterium]
MKRIHSNNKSTVVLIFCLLVCLFAQAQDSLQQIKNMPLAATFIQIDQLQQLYVLKTDLSLIKFDAKGEQIFEYSNSLLGTPSFVDVTDPLNIALYYEDFQTIVLLDRNLTELQSISLFELGFSQVSSIAISNAQHIWLYDETDFKFKKIDRQGAAIFESGDISLGIGNSIRPATLMERDNKLFANDPAQGIFAFDLFGQYLYTIPIKALTHFQYFAQHLIYYQDHQLKKWGLSSKLEQTIIDLSKHKAVQQVIFDQKGQFYLRKAAQVEVWR